MVGRLGSCEFYGEILSGVCDGVREDVCLVDVLSNVRFFCIRCMVFCVGLLWMMV